MKNKNMIRGLVAVLALLLTAGELLSQEAPWFRRGVVSPEIHDDLSVIFRLYAPEAEAVTISGSWMQEWGSSKAMARNDTGLWSILVGPLDPEIYSYSFTVDGVRVLDPSNVQVIRDGRRHASMVLVPGEGSRLYEVWNVPHGTLSKVWYESPALDMTRRMYVYTPPGYSENLEKYPVLYLLHGGGGDEDAWTSLGRVCQIMDNLIAGGKAMPMIVVMPNGNPGEAASPGEAPAGPPERGRGNVRGMGSGLFENSLVSDIIPFVESHYRTLEGRGNRAVTGLSMGGMQTMNLAFDHPEYFDYFGVMSMGLTDPGPNSRLRFRNVDERMEHLKKTGYKLYWIGCGNDDFLYKASQNLVDKLEEFNMVFTYRESSGGHTWSNWRIYLSEFAPLLFKE